MTKAVDPLTWTAAKLSQNYVADYKPFVMVDGEGVRCSLYVSGCTFACVGCFNQAAWPFRYGKPFDEELQARISEDLRHSAVQGLSLLGGEPFLNTQVCLSVVKNLREEHSDRKDVWCWSGFTFDELMSLRGPEHSDKRELLSMVDILVEGRFDITQRDLTLAFRGSRNQRVIDVPQSIQAGGAVLRYT